MNMKKQMLSNIRMMAETYYRWRNISKAAPIYRAYQQEMVRAKTELMLACSEYRVWFCCQSCHDINRGIQ